MLEGMGKKACTRTILLTKWSSVPVSTNAVMGPFRTSLYTALPSLLSLVTPIEKNYSHHSLSPCASCPSSTSPSLVASFLTAPALNSVAFHT